MSPYVLQSANVLEAIYHSDILMSWCYRWREICLWQLVAAEDRGHVQNAWTLARPLKHTHTAATEIHMYYIHATSWRTCYHTI